MARLGYVNIVDSFFQKVRVNKRIRRFIAKYSNIFLVFTILLAFYLFNSKAFVAILFFVISIMSMQHLRYFPWLGIPDMNLILTTYTSINYGLPAGLFLGSASFFGLILSGDIDSNLFFDVIFSYLTAVIASFFLMNAFTPLIIALAIFHIISFFIFHKIFGTLDPMNILWGLTHFFWLIIFATKICSLLGFC